MSVIGGVYFAEAQGLNRVKIGVSKNVRQRVGSLKTGAGFPIRLIAVVPGDIKTEAEMHERFKSLRLHGEWFDLRDDLADYIESLRWSADEAVDRLPIQTVARKRGRPATGRKRTCFMPISLTADERAAINAAAELAGKPPTVWGREVMIAAAAK